MQETPTTQPTDTTDTTQTHPTRRTHRRRWAAAVAALLVLLLLAIATLGGSNPSASGSAGAGDADTSDQVGSHRTSDEDAAEDALDAQDDSAELVDVDLVDGDADDGDPGDTDFEPDGDGDGGNPVDPCADHVAGNGDLLVVPDPLVLPSGDMEDELFIRNCGDGSVDWTAATIPNVSLASTAGTLAAGELTELGFTIDKDAYDPGAIDFKIKVSEPGHNDYIDVHAYRPLTGADMQASNEFSPGPHVGGCAQQCITKAQLVRALTTPDVGLDVATTVPAKVRVYLSTQAPVEDPDGNPWFPGKPAKATSPDGVETWMASLSNLQAATKYFIIVKATDDDGDTAYRSGSFKTVTPLEGPGEFGGNDPEPGCANQCITKAVITPGDGLDPAHLSVRSHTPALFELRLSTQAPTYQNGVPSFAHTDVWENSGLNRGEAWEQDIDGLQPGTKYYGIVRAVDANNHRAYVVGSFTTDGIDVLVTIHTVHLTQDGDDGKYNRGEVRFAWGVGDDTVGTRGEHKMHPGDEIGFPGHESYTVHDATSPLPTVYVMASERDADGKVEFCTMGTGAFHSSGGNASCDSKWNVASSGIQSIGGLDSLDDCSAFGVGGSFADEPCSVLHSEDDLGDDYPEFWAIVSFTVLD